LNKKGQLTATDSPAQPRRTEILRLATATAFYGGGGNFLRLATAYEFLRRLTAAARGSTVPYLQSTCKIWGLYLQPFQRC